jgi:hypothetical protein
LYPQFYYNEIYRHLQTISIPIGKAVLITERVVGRVKPGSIVLFHNGRQIPARPLA